MSCLPRGLPPSQEVPDCPFFLFFLGVAAPLKMVFPKKGSLFSRVTEQLGQGKAKKVLHCQSHVLALATSPFLGLVAAGEVGDPGQFRGRDLSDSFCWFMCFWEGGGQVCLFLWFPARGFVPVRQVICFPLMAFTRLLCGSLLLFVRVCCSDQQQCLVWLALLLWWVCSFRFSTSDYLAAR